MAWGTLREVVLRRENSKLKMLSQLDTSARRDDGSIQTKCIVELHSPLRNRIRFLFEVDGQYRALFWTSVLADGSIAFAPRQEGMAVMGSAESVDGRVHLDFTEARPVEVANRMERKIDFHASGDVKALGKFSTRRSLRDLKEQELMAKICFAHPSKFDVVTPNRGKGDYIVPGPDDPQLNPLPFHVQAVDNVIEMGPVKASYPLLPSKPLIAALFVSPLKEAVIPEDPDMSDHLTVLKLPFTGLRRCQDLMVQWVFGHGLAAAWPERTLVMWSAKVKPPRGT